MLHILNLVDSVEQINYGIWNAVTTLFPYLKDKGCQPEIWFSSNTETPDRIKDHIWKNIRSSDFKSEIEAYEPERTIVVSHGLWREPTQWGLVASKLGFRWIVVPHGMLEPWSMRHKWWKKLPYYGLIESKKIVRADAHIAVGLTEYYNLRRYFHDKVHLLSNAIEPAGESRLDRKPSNPGYTFLFLSRLHKKKGVVPLLRGWLNSKAFHLGAKLIISGPDEGERHKLKGLLRRYSSNINCSTVQLRKATYGSEKQSLLEEAHYFILPSFSEGFPTAVLEAMSFGCYPMLTDGCNFPQAFERDLAIKITTNHQSIKAAVNDLMQMPREHYLERSEAAKKFVDSEFNLNNLSDQALNLYQDLLHH